MYEDRNYIDFLSVEQAIFLVECIILTGKCLHYRVVWKWAKVLLVTFNWWLDLEVIKVQISVRWGPDSA